MSIEARNHATQAEPRTERTVSSQRGSASDAALTPDLPQLLAEMAPLVAVIGDPILDGWFHGTSTRLAREAPAPVVQMGTRHYAPGGAANTAMNLVALGARVRLVGLVGDDEPGRRLRDLLRDAGVDVSGLILSEGTRTTTKDRIVVGDQVIVRLDEEHPSIPNNDALADLARAALVATRDADAEVICDYNSGALLGPVHDALLGRTRTPAITLVDAHDPTRWRALTPDLATPNAQETAAVIGLTYKHDEDRSSVISGFGKQLTQSTGARAVVVTLDRDGTLCLKGSGLVHRTWARPATEKQASGAGDTFVAALTLARACDLPLPLALDLAQSAADVVVTHPGTSVCTTPDLVSHLAGFSDTAISAEDLADRIALERSRGRRVVFTNGCFDVLHRGHTSYLNQAKRLGDVLVVALNDDASVRRLKGTGRPINPVADRVGVLAALSCVDYVTTFATDTPAPLLKLLEPEIYVKGGDYSPDMLAETRVVEAYGGQVRILDYLRDHSTTAVVARIREQRS